MASKKTNRSRAQKEAFYVRIASGEDGDVRFVPATDYIGKPMPFGKPKATCALRVTEKVAAFSLLHTTKKTEATLRGKRVELPRGPLARLERQALALDSVGSHQVIVEISKPGKRGGDTKPEQEQEPAPAPDAPAAGLEEIFGVAPTEPTASLEDIFDAGPADTAVEGGDSQQAAGDAGSAGESSEGSSDGEEPSKPRARRPRPMETDTYTLSLRRDDSGVAYLELEGDGEDLYELPRGSVRLSLYLRAERVDYILAAGFIGHLGKPGGLETISRMAGKVINSLSTLPEFRILSGIETVNLGAPPSAGLVAPVRRNEERVVWSQRVWLFDAARNPIANGEVTCEFDLENANPTSGRLLTHITPDKSIEAVFEPYRRHVEAAITKHVEATLPADEIASITYDIVLGGVDAGTVERLGEVVATIPDLDLAPDQYRPHV